MQKFLNYFITGCLIIIGIITAIKLFYGGGPALSGDYLKDVGAIAQQTGLIMNAVSPYLGNESQAAPDEILNKVTQAKEDLIDLNQQAQKMDSPDNMKGMHQQFLNSLNNYVTAFQLTEEGLQTGDDAKFGQAGELLTLGANQMRGVSQKISRLDQ